MEGPKYAAGNRELGFRRVCQARQGTCMHHYCGRKHRKPIAETTVPFRCGRTTLAWHRKAMNTPRVQRWFYGWREHDGWLFDKQKREIQRPRERAGSKTVYGTLMDTGTMRPCGPTWHNGQATYWFVKTIDPHRKVSKCGFLFGGDKQMTINFFTKIFCWCQRLR